MKKRAIRRLLVSAVIAMALLAIITLTLRHPGSPSSYQFLQGRRPILHERFSSFAVTIYSFPGTLDQVLPEASKELACLGFTETSHAGNPIDSHMFDKKDRTGRAAVRLLSAKLLDETTPTQYAYEHAPDWVSVEIMRSRISWRYRLSRVSRGLIPPPRNPAINHTYYRSVTGDAAPQSH